MICSSDSNMIGRCCSLLLCPLAVVMRLLVHPLVEWWLTAVVGAWEETVRSFFREAIATTVRGLNGASAWFISIFIDRSYYRCPPVLPSRSASLPDASSSPGN